MKCNIMRKGSASRLFAPEGPLWLSRAVPTWPHIFLELRHRLTQIGGTHLQCRHVPSLENVCVCERVWEGGWNTHAVTWLQQRSSTTNTRALTSTKGSCPNRQQASSAEWHAGCSEHFHHSQALIPLTSLLFIFCFCVLTLGVLLKYHALWWGLSFRLDRKGKRP